MFFQWGRVFGLLWQPWHAWKPSIFDFRRSDFTFCTLHAATSFLLPCRALYWPNIDFLSCTGTCYLLLIFGDDVPHVNSIRCLAHSCRTECLVVSFLLIIIFRWCRSLVGYANRCGGSGPTRSGTRQRGRSGTVRRCRALD